MGEAYLQRLIQGGRYDIARKVCQLAIANRSDPAIKAHFEKRLARLDMIGKPAPDIEGKDVDGKPVRLADLKGKVVLVDFWATWCPPCVASFPTLRQLAREYKDRGFAILGVNLDDLARSESGQPGPGPSRLPRISGGSWCPSGRAGPTSSGRGRTRPPRRSGLRRFPASFLIDREGKIIHVELREQALGKTLAQMLGGPAARP